MEDTFLQFQLCAEFWLLSSGGRHLFKTADRAGYICRTHLRCVWYCTRSRYLFSAIFFSTIENLFALSFIIALVRSCAFQSSVLSDLQQRAFSKLSQKFCLHISTREQKPRLKFVWQSRYKSEWAPPWYEHCQRNLAFLQFFNKLQFQNLDKTSFKILTKL